MLNAHGLFWAAVAFWVLLEVYLHVFYNRSVTVSMAERRSKYIMIGLILSGIFGGTVLSSSAYETFAAPFYGYRYLGILIVVLGVLLRIAAVVQLGNAFSVNLGVHEQQQLKSDGLYRWIRHPGYAGDVLAFVGIALVFAHPISSTLAVVLPVSAFVYRIQIEEVMLRQAFGDKYRKYQEQTYKLIPWLY